MREINVLPVSYNKLWGAISAHYIPKKSNGEMVLATPVGLFKMLGISTQTLNAMKHNGNVSLSVIDRLCAELNCQPCDIMELNQSASQTPLEE